MDLINIPITASFPDDFGDSKMMINVVSVN